MKRKLYIVGLLFNLHRVGWMYYPPCRSYQAVEAKSGYRWKSTGAKKGQLLFKSSLTRI